MPIRRNRKAGEVSPESSEDEGTGGPRAYSRPAPPVKRKVRVVKRNQKQRPPTDFEAPNWVESVKSDQFFMKIIKENPQKTMLQCMNEAFPRRQWGKEKRLKSNYWQMTVKAQTSFGGIAWYGVGKGPTKQEAKQNAAVSLIFSWMKRRFPNRDHWTQMKDEMEKILRLSIPESFKNVLYGSQTEGETSKNRKRRERAKSEERPLKRRRMNLEDDSSRSSERRDRRRGERSISRRRPNIPAQRPPSRPRKIAEPEAREMRESSSAAFQPQDAKFAENLIHSALSTESPIQNSERGTEPEEQQQDTENIVPIASLSAPDKQEESVKSNFILPLWGSFKILNPTNTDADYNSYCDTFKFPPNLVMLKKWKQYESEYGFVKLIADCIPPTDSHDPEMPDPAFLNALRDSLAKIEAVKSMPDATFLNGLRDSLEEIDPPSMEPEEISKSPPAVVQHRGTDPLAAIQHQETDSPAATPLQEADSCALVRQQDTDNTAPIASLSDEISPKEKPKDVDLTAKDDVVFIKKMEDGELSDDDSDEDDNAQKSSWNQNWGMDLDGESDDILSGSDKE